VSLHVSGVGRLVADPEQPTNGPAKFRIATDDYNHQTKEREATFWDCAAWGKTAETVMRYCKKGKQVFVVGRLRTRKFQNAQGQEREAVEVNIDSLELLGGGEKTSTSASW
jgi:single-strand DNA-binding protein